jgi:serine/threonine-protein kinase
VTAAPTPLVEALADRYRVLEVVGSGGMATVYRAHDVKHDRTVALKVLYDDLAASLGPARFKREILIAARLQHPHILSVFDSGEAAGRLWYTMPFVSGETLRERLRRVGTLPVDVALRIVREAAQALTYAHRQGVIHRDIKPENILLTEDDDTLVADFGIARAVGDGAFDRSLTQTGSSIGTPSYMAPEQATGESVLDERVDQYALAAVLYEMLTGAPPFTGATAAALVAARFSSDVTSMRTQRAEISGELDAAVLKALSLKPFDRFATITDFARAVAPDVTTPSPFATMPHQPAAPVSRRPWPIAAVVAALVLGGGTAAWRLRSTAPATDAPLRIAVLPLENVGNAADAYFADGMSDELRAKLVSLPGVQVIARASSVRFVGTDKSPAEIADALGVRYLLTGTLRYGKRPDGTSEVQVRPELVEVTDDGPPTTRWQGAFTEPLSNATALQVKIAEQVASQLQVTLGAGDRAKLAEPMTTNPEAYAAYLRSKSLASDDTPDATRTRVAELERATTLDPKFAMAWAELVSAIGFNLQNVPRTDALVAQARRAAERARELAPGSLADHSAWYSYHIGIDADLAKGEQELVRARRLAPSDPVLMGRLGALRYEQGRLQEAGPLLEQALRLDPLNATTVWNYGAVLLRARDYDGAAEPLRRLAALEPKSLAVVLNEVSRNAGKGDVAGAHAAIRDAYRRFPKVDVDTYLATYRDYGWILDDSAQQRVLQAPASAFDNDAGVQLVTRAQILHARGDLAGSREAARRARPALAEHLAKGDQDIQWPYIEAFAAALAGQAEDAERLIRVGTEMERRRATLSEERTYYRELRARVYTLTGQYDKAFDEIEALLEQPGLFGRGQLKLDPIWAPLRKLERYQRIQSMAPQLPSR